ncbi:MAG TPA: alpha/beta hydrolase-fold protein [Gemmatimonas sp.]|uniref:alpha/beta hydrolase n=1 Tax=Gemmatimonas sp. TaxID=1962908 RepID=UPI002ED85032
MNTPLAGAQQDARQGRLVLVADAVSWTLASAEGVRYEVRVAWPVQPPPPAGYPVIYQLDGDATFATTVESMRTRAHRSDATGVAPSLVVGIAPAAVVASARERHATERHERRSDDFTPTQGAAQFRTFLEHVVQPAVQAAFAVDTRRTTLIGHSLGGLFVLDTLLEALHRGTSPYQTYVAISPSIWRGGEALWQAPEGGGAATSFAARVLLTVGEYEQALAPWQAEQANAAEILERRQARRMVDQAQEFAAHLARVGPTLDVQCRVFAGEDHASVVLPTMSAALRLASGIR